MDIGLEQAGAELVLAVDVLQEAVETARLNRPHLPVVQADLRSMTGREVRGLASLAEGDEIDILAGGPPVNNNGKRIDEHHGSLFRELQRGLTMRATLQGTPSYRPLTTVFHKPAHGSSSSDSEMVIVSTSHNHLTAETAAAFSHRGER